MSDDDSSHSTMTPQDDVEEEEASTPPSNYSTAQFEAAPLENGDDFSDISTASLPSVIPSFTSSCASFTSSVNNDSAASVRSLYIPIPLGQGLIDDQLYSSGLFYGVMITDFLPTVTNRAGDYFFALLLDLNNQFLTARKSLILYFICALGEGRYYFKELTASPDRQGLMLKDSDAVFTDINQLLSTLEVQGESFYHRKVMIRGLKRFSWIYHIPTPQGQTFVAPLRTVAYCDSVPHYKGRVLFRRMNDTQESAKKVFNEIRILSRVNNTNIVKFFGVSAFQDFAVLTEFCEEGSLHSIIHDDEEYAEKLPEFNRLRVLFQLSDALIYLKSQGIVHRRIEPKTVLLTANLDVKLSNFAYAEIHSLDMLKKARAQSKSIFRKLRWTRKYKAEELAEMEFPMTNLPESVLEKMLKESPYIAPETAVNHVFSCQSDIWQFAMTLYELFSQKQPFHFAAGPMYKLHNLICTVSTWKTLPRDTPAGIEEIFKKCTMRSGKERMKIEAVKDKLHQLLISLNESRV